MRNTVMGAYWLIPGVCVGLTLIPVLFYKLDRPEIKAQVQNYMAARETAE